MGISRTKCIKNCEELESKGADGTSAGALSFLFACFKQSDADRTGDMTGNVPWKRDALFYSIASWYGFGNNGSWNQYYDLAFKYEAYHEASANPGVDVIPDDNVGSAYAGDESKIKIGPFKMSNYVTASNYSSGGDYTIGSYEDRETPEPEIDSITGEETYWYHSYRTYAGKRSANLQSAFGKCACGDAHLGTVISMSAVLKNKAGQKKEVSIARHDPGEEFYIYLNSSDVEGYDELYEIKCVYQRIHASGEIDTYSGIQHAVTLQEHKEVTYKNNTNLIHDDCKYNCKTCDHTGILTADRSDNKDAGFPKHSWWCATTDYCQHGYQSAQHPSLNVAEHTFCEHAKAGHPEGHPHEKGCYTLSCTITPHTHTERTGSCYYRSCGIDKHTHSDSCYESKPNSTSKELVCTKTEHSHKDSCYTKQCGFNYEHEHTSWSSNSSPGCYNKKTCAYSSTENTAYPHPHDYDCYNCGATGYCKDGHSDGKHGTSESSCLSGTGNFSCNGIHDNCDGDTKCAKHDHLTCVKFYWDDELYNYGDDAADAISVDGRMVNEQIEYTVNVQVPIKTSTSIYKYISKVTHTPTNQVVYESNTRRDMTPAQKAANPLKVEVGDTVEYTIEVNNHERFPIEALIQDTLPTDCELISCECDKDIIVNGEKINAGEIVKIINPTGTNSQTVASWVPCAGYSTTIIKLNVRPLNSAALYNMLYTNNVKFVSLLVEMLQTICNQEVGVMQIQPTEPIQVETL